MTYQSRHVIPRKTEGMADSSSDECIITPVWMWEVFFFPRDCEISKGHIYVCITNIHSVERERERARTYM